MTGTVSRPRSRRAGRWRSDVARRYGGGERPGPALLCSRGRRSARPPAPLFRLSAIDRVWSGHSVGFALAVTADRIVVGYYDAARQLTVASRPRTRDAWVYHKLDRWVGWDSHNAVALAVDDA